MKKLALISTLILFASCQETQKSQRPTKETKVQKVTQCMCPMIYDPVCANGKTFPSKCEAECEGIKDYTKGECN